MKHLHNKVAAITGAGSGIGRALACALAGRGCHLALADINAQGLADTVQLANRYGVRITQHVVDVSDAEAVKAWADAAAAEHGQINLVFNNAGVAQSGTVEGNSLDDYQWLMGINFWGVVYGTKAFLPHLKASGAGHVVNISSIFGLFAQPTMSAYNASKFAVRGFTESLRQELDLSAANVSATCVHPGGIRTNIANSARMNDSVRSVAGKSAAEASAEFGKLLRTSPEKAAQVIIRAVEKNRRRVLIGVDAKATDLMQRLMPSAYQALLVWLSSKMRAQALKQQGAATAHAKAETP